MKIVLRGVPPSLNAFAGRQNPWEYRKAKAEWTERIRQGACKDGAAELGEISRTAREQGCSWEQAKWECGLSG